MDKSSNKQALIKILQAAYSGEKAAALAYSGHWRSVKNLTEKENIQKIEQEEWHHRNILGDMLGVLDSKPLSWREFVFTLIGSILKFLCPISGWFLPMYCAGRLETMNIKEYETASLFAQAGGFQEMAEQLAKMAEVEKQHEDYFYTVIKNHSAFKFIESLGTK